MAESLASETLSSPPYLIPQADLLLASARLFRLPAIDLVSLANDLAAATSTLVYAAGFPVAYCERIAATITALPESLGTTTLEQLTAEYVWLFEGASICPLTETAYVRRDKGVILGDIAGFYRAFGVTASLGEKPDHVAAELEFMATLLVMQVQAITAEDAETVHRALQLFAADHAGELLSLFTAHLAVTTTLPFYRHVAGLLNDIWQGFAIAHGFSLSKTFSEYSTLPYNPAASTVCN